MPRFLLAVVVVVEQPHEVAAALLDLVLVDLYQQLLLVPEQLQLVAAVVAVAPLQVVRLLAQYYKVNQEQAAVADLSGFDGLKVLT
jgi:hypothetical protein